jgi:hypothetical protein
MSSFSAIHTLGALVLDFHSAAICIFHDADFRSSKISEALSEQRSTVSNKHFSKDSPVFSFKNNSLR